MKKRIISLLLIIIMLGLIRVPALASGSNTVAWDDGNAHRIVAQDNGTAFTVAPTRNIANFDSVYLEKVSDSDDQLFEISETEVPGVYRICNNQPGQNVLPIGINGNISKGDYLCFGGNLCSWYFNSNEQDGSFQIITQKNHDLGVCVENGELLLGNTENATYFKYENGRIVTSDGMALSSNTNSIVARNTVEVAANGSSKYQHFYIRETGTNTGKYVFAFEQEGKSTLYLNAETQASNGANLILFDNPEHENSQWYLQRNSQNNSVRIISVQNPNVGIVNNGNSLVLTNADNAGYFFIANDVVDTGKRIVQFTTNNGDAIDVERGNIAKNYKDGTYIVKFKNNYTSNQMFYLTETGENSGKYNISPINTTNGTFYFNAYGGANVEVPIRLWHENDLGSQWILEKCNDGQYLIVSAANTDLAISESTHRTEYGNYAYELRLKQSATRFTISDVIDPPAVASSLSDGTLWIIITIAVFVIGGVVALVIVKKKKKPALADGAEKEAEK